MNRKKWKHTRFAVSEAIPQAGAMPDCFDSLFLRTPRAVQDLRPHAVGVNIQNVSQVNIGAQQTNAAPVQKG
jgi:hypothetical protein